MILLPTFDPTNPASGTFNLNLTGGRGKAIIYNESNSNLKLEFSNNYSSYLPAWTAVMYCFTGIPLTNPLVSYTTVSTLQGVISTTISQVAIEIYDVNEPVGGTFPAALIRQLSVGNNVSSNTSTNQVNNDGNPAVTTFVEATQSGNTSGSNVAIGNDGSFIFAQFVSSVFTQLLKLAPGASPTLQIGKGLVFQAVDNSGANLSNVFGVDSSGNTFVQNHKTNNQTVIYDKNGAALVTVDSSGNVKAKGNNNNKLSNVSFLGTPYLLDNNGSLSNNTTTTETVTGGSTGVPTGAIAVILSSFFTGSAVGMYLQWKPQGATVSDASNYPLVINQVASVITSGTIIVPINTSNGQIDVTAHQGNATGVHTSIIGYII